MNKEVETFIHTLEDLAEEVKHQFKAEIVGVFGSYVRGEQTKSSDLDVLVRFQPGATLFDLVGLADYLEEMLGVKVDVVPVDTIREEIRAQILRKAVYL